MATSQPCGYTSRYLRAGRHRQAGRWAGRSIQRGQTISREACPKVAQHPTNMAGISQPTGAPASTPPASAASCTAGASSCALAWRDTHTHMHACKRKKHAPLEGAHFKDVAAQLALAARLAKLVHLPGELAVQLAGLGACTRVRIWRMACVCAMQWATAEASRAGCRGGGRERRRRRSGSGGTHPRRRRRGRRRWRQCRPPPTSCYAILSPQRCLG